MRKPDLGERITTVVEAVLVVCGMVLLCLFLYWWVGFWEGLAEADRRETAQRFNVSCYAGGLLIYEGKGVRRDEVPELTGDVVCRFDPASLDNP
jgi:hypothetical protein